MSRILRRWDKKADVKEEEYDITTKDSNPDTILLEPEQDFCNQTCCFRFYETTKLLGKIGRYSHLKFRGFLPYDKPKKTVLAKSFQD